MLFLGSIRTRHSGNALRGRRHHTPLNDVERRVKREDEKRCLCALVSRRLRPHVCAGLLFRRHSLSLFMVKRGLTSEVDMISHHLFDIISFFFRGRPRIAGRAGRPRSERRAPACGAGRGATTALRRSVRSGSVAGFARPGARHRRARGTLARPSEAGLAARTRVCMHDRNCDDIFPPLPSPLFFFNCRGALSGRMGARESVPERTTAEALSHARGRAGARARDVRTTMHGA